MKKIITRIFVKIVAVSLILLSFGKNVFAQDNDIFYNSMCIPSPTEIGMIVINVNILILFLISLLLAIFFYARYFIIRKDQNELAKIKTRKALKKAKLCFFISILSFVLWVLFRAYIF